MLQKLMKRHKVLFNDEMGLVREPESDHLAIPVLTDEVVAKPPIRLGAEAKGVVDKMFDANSRQGRMEPVGPEGSPWAMQVFVVTHP
ncbi:hypothetical protein TWF481_002903 [Arthrobotrys musiformis]|uniref:Uncharacterized protein n=1 Tax=Arthrobotrys musiformis TaxID=47236 RepID=A0AAV9VTC0_9PEZI